MFDFDHFLGSVMGILLVLVILVIVVFGAYFLTGIPAKKACNHLEELHPGLDFDWTYMTGCLVKSPDGLYVDSDEFLQYYGDLHTLQVGDAVE